MPLKSLLEEIKNASNVEINLTNENVFCFDSESFRLLAALKDGICKYNKIILFVYAKDSISV